MANYRRFDRWPKATRRANEPTKNSKGTFFRRLLRRSSIVAVVEIVGLVSIPPAIFTYMVDLRERQIDRINQSWQLLTTKAPGNSGKIQALEYLNSETYCLPFGIYLPWYGQCWKERVPLVGLDLSKPEGGFPPFLDGVQLEGADLRHANFSGTALRGANLKGANLLGAIFKDAEVLLVDFEGAALINTDFTSSSLTNVDAGLADFSGANFTHARLEGVRAQFADFSFSNWNEAKVSSTTFANSMFLYADLISTTVGKPPLGSPQETSMAPYVSLNVDLSGTIFVNTNMEGADIWIASTDENSKFRCVANADKSKRIPIEITRSFDNKNCGEISTGYQEWQSVRDSKLPWYKAD